MLMDLARVIAKGGKTEKPHFLFLHPIMNGKGHFHITDFEN